MRISRRFVLFAALALAAALSFVGLQPRLSAERAHKSVAFVTEYKDITSLSAQSGLTQEEILQKLSALGVRGLGVAEYTGDELSQTGPLPLRYGSVGTLGVKASGVRPDRAVIVIASSEPFAEPVREYITRKMPRTVVANDGGDIVLILPAGVDELKICAFMPDFTALDFCERTGARAIFRPGPCTPSSGEEAADALTWLVSSYPHIKNVIPSGAVVTGYPKLKPVAEALKSAGISLSNVEFVKQVGMDQFAKLMYPSVIPLHSVTRDELLSKKISQRQLLERFVRAVHERSVRLLMAHPFELYSGNRLDTFLTDLAAAKEAIEARGYGFGWPQETPVRGAPAAGAAGCALVLVFCAWFYGVRLNRGEALAPPVAELVGLVAFTALLAAAMLKIPFAAKLCGGFCGAFFAAEAAMTALENGKKPWFGALGGLFIIIAGGLSIASFYGTTQAALRLTPFSGVKLTLLLPPLLLLCHDLTLRIHPESVGEIVERPALWGELALIGVMMLAMLIMALRSDNVSNVPAMEVAFRDFMERALLVRPRTKEFLIGYPALVVYWYLVRRGLWAHYREVVRIAAVLAFCSAANTFCHFHTMFTLSLIRVLNGWWLGLLIGVVCAALLRYAAEPLWKRGFRRA